MHASAKAWGARGAACLVSTLIALVILEIGLRFLQPDSVGGSAAGIDQLLAESAEASLGESQGRYSLYGLVEPSPHADVVYRIKPSLRGSFRDQPIMSNRFGQRQLHTPAIPKPEASFRIVGLGDSHMFGWGVAQGQDYLSLLADTEWRNDIGRPIDIETVNCSAPGYNTAMEVAKFEHECAWFEPDLVVLHWVGNDFDYPHFMQPARSGAARQPATAAEPAWRNLYVMQALSGAVGSRSSPDASDELDPTALPELLPHGQRGAPKPVRHAARAQYADSVGEKGTMDAFDRLAEIVEDRGTPVLVLMLGTGSERRRWVAEQAGLRGFHVVNAAPRFAAALEQAGFEGTRAEFKARYQIPRDGHPSVEAHQQYAVVLQNALRPFLSR